MRYLLQVRFNGADAVIRELSADEQQRVTTEFEALWDLPGLLDGGQLEAASSATSVRVDDGETIVDSGPAVAADAQLDGYYVYEAPDLAAAVTFAARIPVARMGGMIEVRPLKER
jgi:hypothetical protein